MKIKVLFFAQLRDTFGQDECRVELPEKSRVRQLTALLYSSSSKPLTQSVKGASRSTLEQGSSRLGLADARPRSNKNTADLARTRSEIALSPCLYYAVNENFVGENYQLTDGDTVALMTPVSGG